ncbi:proteobacterial dedicated sortase system histidine kinase [Pseudoalteromonas sp. Cnat2-41]|uniref:proteobacterial dedicated sortase system histidine kinase n=1 Tax=unclassified Pseudoalteromonas TaxID=194690 RepID=UPI001EF8F1D3|nr:MULTISPECIES: proteobacterial dedicated sortase system histidine kinase [unclassified Pseudoalteromonas]MCF2862860.1 proteobacterial dedicated sortase system histidine kinase [Pseudoalteromonas sp. CNAT2-18]MCG7558688.1 proteobacterial dedicated sortase system histidine kinase [Pseudoalteromonas sp. CNAT2-18.1]
MARFGLGLRSKVIVLSCFLFVLPWLGYEYVWEMEKYLRKGQEKTLVGTTRALATALHERPALFENASQFTDKVEKGRDLYAYSIDNAIRLDGELGDWQPYQELMWQYHGQYLSTPTPEHDNADLSFRHMVGKYGNYLYAVFAVRDDTVRYRPKNALGVSRNDHLKIAIKTPQGELTNYIVATREDGWVNAFELPSLQPYTQIQGYFRRTAQGYNIELRMPLNMLGNKLGFAISDWDDGQQQRHLMATSNVHDANRLGTVLLPSPEIKRIIKGMGHSGSRIWVVDKHHRVLAQSGTIQHADGVWASSLQENEQQGAWQRFEERFLHPLYYKILTRPPSDFLDTLHDVAALEGSHIANALKGKPASNWRLTPDNKAVILSAAYPIWGDDQVLGAVIAEETTNGVRTLRNKALEKLFNVILAVMFIGTITLFFFASRISSRIRRLRDSAEQAIDEQGRVRGTLTLSKDSDEIGDLSRSFANIVNRLGGYTHYLENMSSRLSHELRTPVAVVRSSLENLQMIATEPQQQKYLTRAQEGVNRLNKLITTMSEATRLEQSISTAKKEHYDLQQVVLGCMQGYQFAYPQAHFDINISDAAIPVEGSADFLAQLLDKLINNALEFAYEGSAIGVSLERQAQHAVLKVSNQGPALPADIGEHIFDSMVSVREQDKQQQPHLGLGLYVARLIADYHQAQIKAENLADGNGVVFSLTIKIIQD